MRIDIDGKLRSPSTGKTRDVIRSSVTALTDVQDGDASHLGLLDASHSVRAAACIYCSAPGTSDEHAIPYAWGGTVQIFRGSCDDCRGTTSRFEGFTLNDGGMTNARWKMGLPSRSRHKSAPKTVGVVTIDKDGRSAPLEVETEQAPVIVGFPIFSPPGLLSGDHHLNLKLDGLQPLVFCDDAEGFMRRLGAEVLRVTETDKDPVAFAQTIAKIAYCCAWCAGVLEFLDSTGDLVRAFMREPDRLGLFVGAKPSPPERFSNLDFRVLYRPDHLGLLVAEVQPFPRLAAPTYLVVLGHLPSLRAWRQIRSVLKRYQLPAVA